MNLIIAGVLLTLAVLLNSIELSLQSGTSERGPRGRGLPGTPARMRLPYPYYYVTTNPDAEIRSTIHPTAHEIRTEDGFFLGMAENDGRTFYPITLPNGLVVTINLKERYTNYLTPEEVRELTRAITGGASSSRTRSRSPNGSG